MADAHGSGPCVRKDVRVQLPPRPPMLAAYGCFAVGGGRVLFWGPSPQTPTVRAPLDSRWSTWGLTSCSAFGHQCPPRPSAIARLLGLRPSSWGSAFGHRAGARLSAIGGWARPSAIALLLGLPTSARPSAIGLWSGFGRRAWPGLGPSTSCSGFGCWQSAWPSAIARLLGLRASDVGRPADLLGVRPSVAGGWGSGAADGGAGRVVGQHHQVRSVVEIILDFIVGVCRERPLLVGG